MADPAKAKPRQRTPSRKRKIPLGRSKIQAQALFDRLCALYESDRDAEKLHRLARRMAASGYPLRLRRIAEEPEFPEDENYTEVITTCVLRVGAVKVDEWEETWWGYYGGGAGWWVERGDSTCDWDLERMLECLGIEAKEPTVPEPPPLPEDEEFPVDEELPEDDEEDRDEPS